MYRCTVACLRVEDIIGLSLRSRSFTFFYVFMSLYQYSDKIAKTNVQQKIDITAMEKKIPEFN